jgi:hypothetical protein
MKEGDIRKLLKARVEAYGGEVRAVSWLGRKNAPDVLALFPQSIPDPVAPPTYVETKRPGKDATAAQAREHERMRAAGCVVRMVRNEQELDAWLPPL